MCKENHLQHPSVADLRRGSDLVAAGSFHDTDTANYSAEDFRSTTKGYRPIGVAWPARERVRAVVLLGKPTKLRLEQRPRFATVSGLPALEAHAPRSHPRPARLESFPW